MKLTPSTAQELRERLTLLRKKQDELRRTIEQAEREMQALQTLLGEDVAAPAEQPATLAGRVREAVRRFGRPVAPSDVVEQLVADGEDRPRDQLSIAVSSILHRMAQSETSPIAKLARGQYFFELEPDK